MQTWRTWFGAEVVALLTLLSVACGGSGNPQAGSQVVSGAQPPAANAPYVDFSSPQIFTIGVEATSDRPYLDHPSGNTFSISPELPPGLVIDASSGVISGVPTGVAPAVSYTITVDNEAGKASTVVLLEVDEGPLFYSSPAIVDVGFPVTPLVPRNPPADSSYSVTPKLPGGLSIDPATGVISGTPSSPQPATYYEISANRPMVALKFGLTLGVNDPAASDTSGAAPSSTLDCEHSGGFIGTYEGLAQPHDQGLISIAFEADGTARARVLDASRNTTQRSDGPSALTINPDGSLDISLTGSVTGTLHGSFVGANFFSGTYTSGGLSRPFKTARLGGSATAQVRYTGGSGADATADPRIDFGVLDRTDNNGVGVGYEFSVRGSDPPQYRLLNWQFPIQGTFSTSDFTWTAAGIGEYGDAMLPSVGLGLELGYIYGDDVLIEMLGCRLR